MKRRNLLSLLFCFAVVLAAAELRPAFADDGGGGDGGGGSSGGSGSSGSSGSSGGSGSSGSNSGSSGGSGSSGSNSGSHSSGSSSGSSGKSGDDGSDGSDDGGGDDKSSSGTSGDDDGDESDHDKAARAVRKGDVMPYRSVLRQLQGQASGRVLRVELARNRERPVYRLKVEDAQGSISTLVVDARTGRLLSRTGR